MSYKVIVKRTSDSSSIEVEVDPEQLKLVSQLVNEVRVAFGIDSTKHLRLISQGKLLEPENAELSVYNLKDGSFVHLVVTDLRPVQTQQQQRVRTTRRNNNQLPQPNVLAPRGGFNELAYTHGLDADGIAALRASFSTEVDEFRREMNMDMLPGEGEARFRSRVETQWIMNQNQYSMFWGNLPARPSGIQELATNRARGARGSSRLERLVNDDNDEEDDSALYRGEGWSLASLLGRQGYSRVQARNEDDEDERGQELVTRRSSDAEGGEGHGDGDENDLESGSLSQEERSSTGGMRMNREVSPEDQLGTYKDCFWGCMLGSAFGTLMLLCIFDRNMNYRNKIGILVGITLQLLISISENNRINEENANQPASKTP
jgi:hypothetical protein